MVLFHADDYGIHLRQSKRILRCSENGCLNSLSVIPNSARLEECMELLDKGITCGIHLNFVEGSCCAKKEKVAMLVDEEGKFRLSFEKMLLLSVIRGRTIREQVKEECIAQIQKLSPYMDHGIRIDSHRHYHMIPAVFHGLYDACLELDAKVTYIRWPVEPFLPYLLHREIWGEITLANIAKNMLLRICGAINYPVLAAAGWRQKTAVFFGILLTGRMFYGTVERLLPDFMEYAQKRNKDLEILFHPGAIYPGEEYLDHRYAGFYREKNRALEAETLLKLNFPNQTQREENHVQR